LNRVIDTFGTGDFNNGLDTFFVFKCYIGIIVGAGFELVVGFESHARCGNIYDIDINGSWLIRTAILIYGFYLYGDINIDSFGFSSFAFHR
jgi:hypothetical protein